MAYHILGWRGRDDGGRQLPSPLRVARRGLRKTRVVPEKYEIAACVLCPVYPPSPRWGSPLGASVVAAAREHLHELANLLAFMLGPDHPAWLAQRSSLLNRPVLLAVRGLHLMGTRRHHRAGATRKIPDREPGSA